MRVNLLLYIHSNNAGKNVTTKTFQHLRLRPRQIPGGRVTRLLKIPWASQLFLHFFGKLLEQFICKKKRLGSAGTRRATRLAGSPIFEGRVTLLSGKTFLPCRYTLWLTYPGQLAKCRFTEHARAL